MISQLINQQQIAILESELGELLESVRYQSSDAARQINDSAENTLLQLRSAGVSAADASGFANSPLRELKLKVRFTKRKWKRFQTASKRTLRQIGGDETHVATNAA